MRSFFFNDTATTEIYTLSLHDALPIWTTRPHSSISSSRQRERHDDRLGRARTGLRPLAVAGRGVDDRHGRGHGDRKSTRLNSSHANISYAVFCLKKIYKRELFHLPPFF